MLAQRPGSARSGLSLTKVPNNEINPWGATKLYFHPIFVLIPVLAIAAVLGISFAIVGTGHRNAWMLVLPIVIAAWYSVEEIISQFVRSSLLPIFWGLVLPVILSVAAWIFRRFRERRGM